MLNFTRHDDEIINLNIKGENKKNNLLFDKIILKKNNDRIHFDNLILSKNFQVSNFNEIDLKYIDKKLFLTYYQMLSILLFV